MLEKSQGTLIFETITGSTSRGTNIKNVSDEDRKGIYMPPLEAIFSLNKPQETITLHEPEDREYHTLEKFLSLAANKSNPTILEMLFTEERFFTELHPVMRILFDNRDIFLTKKVYYSFYGYAKDQLMRIKNAKLGTSPQEKEEHIEYVINRVLRDNELRYPTMAQNGNFIELESANFVGKNDAEVEIASKNKEKEKYDLRLRMNVENGEFTQLFGMMNELRNVLHTYNSITGRNRKPTEKRLWKHAMQLVVLAKMGVEVLMGNGLKVFREHDREELLRIRNGEMSWEEFFDYVEKLLKELDTAKAVSTLPENVDMEKVNELYFKMVKEFYKL